MESLWAVHGVLHEQNISTVRVLDLHSTTLFPSTFGNATIFPDINYIIKYGPRAAESYVELDGSSPNARLGVNTMENSPQSTPFLCCCTGTT